MMTEMEVMTVAGVSAVLPLYDGATPQVRCAVYMAKWCAGPQGGYQVHLYNRRYDLMGYALKVGDWQELALHPKRTDSWADYTGGSDEVTGLAIWIDLDPRVRSEYDLRVAGLPSLRGKREMALHS
jgi:hypothetical protein